MQQKVQILRGPDGKLQVRGLMPGQQLVQMPDGKLHVLNTSQNISVASSPQSAGGTTSAVTPTSTKVLTNAVKLINTPGKTPAKIVGQVNQTEQSPGQLQQVLPTNQKLKTTVVSPGTPIGQQQKIVVANTMQGTQVIFFYINNTFTIVSITIKTNLLY